MPTRRQHLHGRAKVCKSCGYAYTGEKCTNPACRTVNPQAHARHQAEAHRRRAEQAERDRIAAIRRRHGGY